MSKNKSTFLKSLVHAQVDAITFVIVNYQLNNRLFQFSFEFHFLYVLVTGHFD